MLFSFRNGLFNHHPILLIGLVGVLCVDAKWDAWTEEMIIRGGKPKKGVIAAQAMPQVLLGASLRRFPPLFREVVDGINRARGRDATQTCQGV